MAKDYTLRFSDESEKRLLTLIDKTKADNTAEVIKNALRLYDGMIEITEAGTELFTKDSSGNFQPFNPWQDE